MTDMETKPGFFTVEQVARELEMTKDGVYKLIKRGRLKAIRVSERNIRVSDVALAAYRRRVSRGDADPTGTALPAVKPRTFQELLDAFVRDTGRTPEQWCEAWKRDDVEDSPENQRRTMSALALCSWDELDDTKRAASLELAA
ncbi:MAG: helix-turn-helix domain-containing protein [Patulibacter sp.]|nr:helix-turn-helix domain-containing protein [Patulibacter sp.]